MEASIEVIMDFAVIKTGGKQYKVKVGDTLKVEKISDGTDKKDAKLKFDDILFGKEVTAVKIADGKLKKVRILKFRPKKRYKRIRGHRQSFSEIKIEKIT